jgi:D-arabinose 1-dehydrogenase-like Zn-dependent alcohol dehydrogenase
MKAFAIDACKAPLALHRLPEPVPGPGAVVIAIAAAA